MRFGLAALFALFFWTGSTPASSAMWPRSKHARLQQKHTRLLASLVQSSAWFTSAEKSPRHSSAMWPRSCNVATFWLSLIFFEFFWARLDPSKSLQRGLVAGKPPSNKSRSSDGLWSRWVFGCTHGHGSKIYSGEPLPKLRSSPQPRNTSWETFLWLWVTQEF